MHLNIAMAGGLKHLNITMFDRGVDAFKHTYVWQEGSRHLNMFGRGSRHFMNAFGRGARHLNVTTFDRGVDAFKQLRLAGGVKVFKHNYV